MNSHELITLIQDKINALLDDDTHDINFIRLHEEILSLLAQASQDPLLNSYNIVLQRVTNAVEQYCASPQKLTVLNRDLKNPTLSARERMGILSDIEAEEKRRESAHFTLRREVNTLTQLASQLQ